MSLSRDRLARPVDISSFIPSARRRVGLIVEEPGLHRGLGTPVRDSAVEVARRGMFHRSPIARANARMRAQRRARGRGGAWVTSSGLRSWYPRTPLRDVTAVVRAIERRRSREANETEAQRDGNEGTSDPTQTTERTTVLHPFQDENLPPSAQLEHDMSFKTPVPASFSKKPQNSPASLAWNIVASLAREKHDGHLTPDKLLNSIEKVREAVLEDQRRLQNTPAAKKAERERKIRTLKSMR